MRNRRTMTMAKGRCESEPMPCEVAAGSSPRVATSIVIMMGRRRSIALSTADSLIECPRTRSWLMYSSMMTPVCTGDAEERQKAYSGRDARGGVCVIRRASIPPKGAMATIRQNQQSPFCRPEHSVENHEDKQDRDGHLTNAKRLLARLPALILPRPVEGGSRGGASTVAVDLGDGLLRPCRQSVAAANAVFDRHIAFCSIRW